MYQLYLAFGKKSKLQVLCRENACCGYFFASFVGNADIFFLRMFSHNNYLDQTQYLLHCQLQQNKRIYIIIYCKMVVNTAIAE